VTVGEGNNGKRGCSTKLDGKQGRGEVEVDGERTGYTLEGRHVFWDAWPRFDRSIARALAIGYDVLAGLFCDLLRNKSFAGEMCFRPASIQAT